MSLLVWLLIQYIMRGKVCWTNVMQTTLTGRDHHLTTAVVHCTVCDEWCCFSPPLWPTVSLCLLWFHSLCTHGGSHSACCLFIYVFLLCSSPTVGDHLGAELAVPRLDGLLFYAINAYQWPLSDLIYCQRDHDSAVHIPHDMLTGES